MNSPDQVYGTQALLKALDTLGRFLTERNDLSVRSETTADATQLRSILEKLEQTPCKDRHRRDSLAACIRRHAVDLESIRLGSLGSKEERLEQITQVLSTQLADLKRRLLDLWRQTYLPTQPHNPIQIVPIANLVAGALLLQTAQETPVKSAHRLHETSITQH